MAKGSVLKISRHVHFLRTGLTETKLQLVGVVTLMWNGLEIAMRKYAWTCGQMDETAGSWSLSTFRM